jgi:hypothetical protein
MRLLILAFSFLSFVWTVEPIVAVPAAIAPIQIPDLLQQCAVPGIIDLGQHIMVDDPRSFPVLPGFRSTGLADDVMAQWNRGATGFTVVGNAKLFFMFRPRGQERTISASLLSAKLDTTNKDLDFVAQVQGLSKSLQAQTKKPVSIKVTVSSTDPDAPGWYQVKATQPVDSPLVAQTVQESLIADLRVHRNMAWGVYSIEDDQLVSVFLYRMLLAPNLTDRTTKDLIEALKPKHQPPSLTEADYLEPRITSELYRRYRAEGSTVRDEIIAAAVIRELMVRADTADQWAIAQLLGFEDSEITKAVIGAWQIIPPEKQHIWNIQGFPRPIKQEGEYALQVKKFWDMLAASEFVGYRNFASRMLESGGYTAGK